MQIGGGRNSFHPEYLLLSVSISSYEHASKLTSDNRYLSLTSIYALPMRWRTLYLDLVNEGTIEEVYY